MKYKINQMEQIVILVPIILFWSISYFVLGGGIILEALFGAFGALVGWLILRIIKSIRK